MADYNKDSKEDCVYNCDDSVDATDMNKNFDDDYFVRIPRKDYLEIVRLLQEVLDLIKREKTS